MPTVQLVVPGLLEVLHQMLVEWRSASTECGELFVTVVGMQQMQMLYAVNLGSSVMVSYSVEWLTYTKTMHPCNVGPQWRSHGSLTHQSRSLHMQVLIILWYCIKVGQKWVGGFVQKVSLTLLGSSMMKWVFCRWFVGKLLVWLGSIQFEVCYIL